MVYQDKGVTIWFCRESKSDQRVSPWNFMVSESDGFIQNQAEHKFVPTVLNTD